jgi:O-antigen/teichoic acid export membrane protein
MKANIQIIRNIFVNWGTYFLGTFIGFIMMPFLIKSLGDDIYGIWILIISMTGYLGILDLGINATTIKYTAEYLQKEDINELNKMGSTIFTVYFVLGFLAIILAVIFATQFLPYFNVKTEVISQAKIVTIVVGINIGLTLPLSFFSGFIRGMQRYDVVSIFSIIILIYRTVLIIVFLKAGFGIVALSLIHLSSTVISGIIKIRYVKKCYNDFKIKFKFVDYETLKKAVNFGAYVLFYMLATKMIFATNSLIIGFKLDTADITYYAIAARLTEFVRIFIMASGVLLPTVTQYLKSNQFGKVQELTILSTKYNLMFAIPIVALFVLCGKPLIQLWVGEKYAHNSYIVLILLSIGMIAHISKFSLNQVLQGLEKHKVPAYIALIEGTTNVILSIVLIEKFKLVGVALGSMIPMLFYNLLIIQIYGCKELKIRFFEYYFQSIIRPIIIGLIGFMMLLPLIRIIRVQSIFDLLFVSVLTILIYLGIYMCFCVKIDERKRLLSASVSAIKKIFLTVKEIFA